MFTIEIRNRILFIHCHGRAIILPNGKRHTRKERKIALAGIANACKSSGTPSARQAQLLLIRHHVSAVLQLAPQLRGELPACNLIVNCFEAKSSGDESVVRLMLRYERREKRTRTMGDRGMKKEIEGKGGRGARSQSHGGDGWMDVNAIV